MGARIVGLLITNTRKNGNTVTITVRSPKNNQIAPPQKYMLWVVDNGTPSVAKWIQVGAVPAAVTKANWPKFM
ncbi:hypothetical protein HDV00_004760 [Rhizophlyctis rosea]|nr:hypothetical protein HDV00_004760 [Rhizophlyctis rosea]